MITIVLRLLSFEGSGLVLAATVLFAGLNCTLWLESAAGRILGIGLMILGVIGVIGALRQLLSLARFRKRFPPPGRRVDVGGFAVHVLAEGQPAGGPTVVWFPGAHLGGFALHHLHRLWRTQGRSILIDRPGTGWSDTGSFPRTTAKEATEVIHALERAGESAPFLLVGHSFGGLLAANIARRYPERIAAVVLLDPTPLETIVFGPPLQSLKTMRRNALTEALRRLFGMGHDPIELQRRDYPQAHALWDRMVAVLGVDVQAGLSIERSAGAMCAAASIYQELTPEGAARAGWDTIVYDGDLEGLRVLLVAPRDTMELETTPEFRSGTAQDAAAGRALRFYARTRERYLATSSLSERIHTPPGTGHNFPYEVPEFVLEVVRRAADLASAASLPARESL